METLWYYGVVLMTAFRWWAILVLEGHYPACFTNFSAPTHLIWLNGRLPTFSRTWRLDQVWWSKTCMIVAFKHQDYSLLSQIKWTWSTEENGGLNSATVFEKTVLWSYFRFMHSLVNSQWLCYDHPYTSRQHSNGWTWAPVTK